MFSTAGTEPLSSLLLLALTLLVLPAVLMPALAAYIAASTGFRPFGTLTIGDLNRLPAPNETWLWGLALIAVGWVAWRLARERAGRTMEGAPVHAKVSKRKAAPAREAMVSVFGAPELWSNVGHRWGRRSGKASKAKSKVWNDIHQGLENRLSRLGIQWNWRRPWTVILSPRVQPQEASLARREEMDVDDYASSNEDLQGYTEQEGDEGVEGTEVYSEQEEILEGVEAGRPVEADPAGYAGYVEQGYSVTDYAVEAYPASDTSTAEQPVEQSFAVRVGARGFRSGG